MLPSLLGSVEYCISFCDEHILQTLLGDWTLPNLVCLGLAPDIKLAADSGPRLICTRIHTTIAAASRSTGALGNGWHAHANVHMLILS